ncbi:MAG: 4Fe-4S binding protein [Clostridiales bacterium]|nr:4Fe-4S binding protein [Clostridiales bacterium]
MDSQRRKIIQIIAAVAQNSHFSGFATGRVYSGKLKAVCVPGLNCYSCPGALGSCPIGALQQLAMSPKFGASFYVYGFLLLAGLIGGRLVCGFLCPFGLLQELLHKIPLPKLRESRALKALNKAKYAVLGVLVIGVPTLLNIGGGVPIPAFCQFVCPAGTLEAGIPLVLLDGRLGAQAGLLFAWKAAVLALAVLAATAIFRPFCRFLCPLGAIYSLFNKISVVQIRRDAHLCDGCGKCAQACPMHAEDAQSPECIRCGKCAMACPSSALRWCVKAGGGPAFGRARPSPPC